MAQKDEAIGKAANDLDIPTSTYKENISTHAASTDWNSGDEFNVVVLEYGTKERYLEGDFRPILLTEEWLLKFDFLRHHLDYSNGVIYIKNVPENNEFEWGVFPNELGSGIQIKNRIKLKYVHQLQNLHFALTGEELTFNFK